MRAAGDQSGYSPICEPKASIPARCTRQHPQRSPRPCKSASTEQRRYSVATAPVIWPHDRQPRVGDLLTDMHEWHRVDEYEEVAGVRRAARLPKPHERCVYCVERTCDRHHGCAAVMCQATRQVGRRDTQVDPNAICCVVVVPYTYMHQQLQY